MTPKELRRAAHLLAEEARALQRCHTVFGKWPPDYQHVKAEAAECRDLARKLRKLARSTP
jgi:hypothetical protein